MTDTVPARAVVTGATGFVGRRLAARLPGSVDKLALGNEDWRRGIAATDWRNACVYHLAARVHEARTGDADFERDNVEMTVALAEAAAAGGATRLVFLSTIKVNGEQTHGRPFKPADAPSPEDAYRRSKWRAEQALGRVSRDTGIEVVVVRSPLVIGPGARANLLALMRMAASRMPLPFASLRNRRTLVGVHDLAALLETCGNLPQASGRTFLAGHPEPLSTPRLLGAIRAAWNRPAGLFAVSPGVLEAAAAVVAARKKMYRLTRSLEVDVTATMRELAWTPSQTMDAAIAEMALAFRDEESH